MNIPKTIEIKEIREEALNIKTFIFDYSLNAVPGQFVMLWLPRKGEKPFSIALEENRELWITVKKRGKFTKALHEKREGDLIGIRGAYGKWFSLQGKKVLMVAGGYGTAPLHFLARKALRRGIEVNFLIGAKTKEEIIFAETLKEKGAKVEIATEDGSEGIKGTVIDLVKKINAKEIDFLYSCGPEKMMEKVLEWSEKNNVRGEMSLERYMKCGIGICGQCCVDGTGKRICRDGPVFELDEVRKINEFAKYNRTASGRKENL